MSISGLSSSSYNIANLHRDRRQELSTLASAVQAGNLQGAQQALAAFQSNAASGSTESGAIQDARTKVSSIQLQGLDSSNATKSSGRPQLPEGLQALFDAVSSGDMDAAQSALEALEEEASTERSAAPPPPPPPPAQSSQLVEDLQSIFEAIESGDIGAAQEALVTFQQSSEGVDSGSEASSDFDSILTTLLDAVQSGDIDAAQGALEDLKDAASAVQGPPPPPPPPQDGFMKDLQSIFEALESGDIDAAQDALTTLLQNGTDATSSDASSQVEAFKSLLDAVKSGDLDAAQEALASLDLDDSERSTGTGMLMIAQRAYSEWQSTTDTTQLLSV